jgi:hypothetical protein
MRMAAKFILSGDSQSGAVLLPRTGVNPCIPILGFRRLSGDGEAAERMVINSDKTCDLQPCGVSVLDVGNEYYVSVPVFDFNDVVRGKNISAHCVKSVLLAGLKSPSGEFLNRMNRL